MRIRQSLEQDMLEEHKAIPFFFRLASNAFTDIGSVGRIEKKEKLKKT